MGEAGRGAGPRGHIVLVGLPGAGKTTVGRALAERLGRPFVDFDAEIVRRTGKSVAELFATSGEQHFRDLEAAMTQEVAKMEPSVLAPGGGWITQPGLADRLGSDTLLIHLSVSPATAVARMAGGVESRPLLTGGDAEGKIAALWRRREAAYSRADLVIDTEMLDVQEVTDAVLRSIPPSA